MRKAWRELSAGNVWIVDVDLRQYFDTIDQEKLIDLIAEDTTAYLTPYGLKSPTIR